MGKAIVVYVVAFPILCLCKNIFLRLWVFKQLAKILVADHVVDVIDTGLIKGGALVPLAAIAQQDPPARVGKHDVADGYLFRIAIKKLSVALDCLHRKNSYVCLNLPQKAFGISANQYAAILRGKKSARAERLDVISRQIADRIDAVGDHGDAADAWQKLCQKVGTAGAVQKDNVARMDQRKSRLCHLLFLRAVFVCAQGVGDSSAGGIGKLDAAVATVDKSSLLQIFQISADAGGTDVHSLGEVFHRYVVVFIQKLQNFVFAFTFVHK